MLDGERILIPMAFTIFKVHRSEYEYITGTLLVHY